ncbi:hypothetical protein [Glycomyces sp. NPDC047010]|uniref:hypothetical protein n=1 Tax=Glycomyces sp. NPDC047010 TaxID=3155023 RepID=UPI0033CACFCC
MSTETHTPRGALGHRIAWATGPLVIVLVAAALYNGWVAPMDPAIGFALDFTALWAAIATALLTRNRVLQRTAWVLAPVCWILAFYDWFGYGWTGSAWGWTDALFTPAFFVLMAMPPCWLAFAVWHRKGSLLAEAGALAVMAMALFVLTIYISTAVDPADPTGWFILIYGAAAALLALAAWRRADRRIAYGFIAVLLAVLAAGSHWLFYNADPALSPPGFIGIEVFAPGVVAVGVLAGALQFGWNAVKKHRTKEPAAA